MFNNIFYVLKNSLDSNFDFQTYINHALLVYFTCNAVKTHGNRKGFPTNGLYARNPRNRPGGSLVLYFGITTKLILVETPIPHDTPSQDFRLSIKNIMVLHVPRSNYATIASCPPIELSGTMHGPG